jgi:hypothetical protein
MIYLPHVRLRLLSVGRHSYPSYCLPSAGVILFFSLTASFTAARRGDLRRR